jgi:hypothetical protein
MQEALSLRLFGTFNGVFFTGAQRREKDHVVLLYSVFGFGEVSNGRAR